LNRRITCSKGRRLTNLATLLLEAEIGVEPMNDEVAAHCLTTWLPGLGVREGVRIPDLWSHNPTLCQLSYAHHETLHRPDHCTVAGVLNQGTLSGGREA
jgi:hypothetical protein